jgi:hypothetical protein
MHTSGKRFLKRYGMILDQINPGYFASLLNPPPPPPAGQRKLAGSLFPWPDQLKADFGIRMILLL